MLAFIVPLRSACVSTSWERVCALLERTLRSICNQTSSDFKVIVVCHEQPNIRFSSSFITYIHVDFSPPHLIGNQMADLSAKDQDKNKKILIGLTHAHESNCSYVMVVDSDDCISKKIAGFVSKNTNKNGWFIESGYEYQEGSNFVKIRKKNLHEKTGTSNIIKIACLKPEMEKALEDIKDDFLFHNTIVSLMKKRNTPLAPLPFPGTVYVTDTGENSWAQGGLFWERDITPQSLYRFFGGKIYKFFITQPLTDIIKNEFCVYKLADNIYDKE
jgi:hypothetical protein